MFTYGDIVKHKFAKTIEYHIVTDIADLSEKGDGSDMLYEVMRIFPIMKASKMANYDDRQLELVGKGNEKEGRMVMDWVMKQRLERDWKEEPDFLAVIDHNKKMNKLKEVLPPQLDVIRYDKLPDVDACLDAMNDLKSLHETFGDQAYLTLREIVIDRLKYFLD